MKEKKKRSKRDLSLIFEEKRVNKRRLLKLAEESSFSSSAKNENSTITAQPMNVVAPHRLAVRASRLT